MQLRSSSTIVSIALFLFFIGDRVLISTETLQLAGTHKLNPRFIGPFAVTVRMGHVAYKLDLSAAYSPCF